VVWIALLAVAAIAAAVGFALSRSVSAPGAVEPPAIVWAVGDGADDSAMSKALGARIASVSSDRFLYLGDVYETGTYTEFRRNTPRPTDDSSVGPRRPWQPRVAEPQGGLQPLLEGGPRRSQDGSLLLLLVGGWQFLSVNSELPHRSGSAQLAWLKGRLSGGRELPHRLLARPRFSAGTTHGDAPDMDPVWQALRGHAALVLSGHDHSSQRRASTRVSEVPCRR
jgi:hypothetical protein